MTAHWTSLSVLSWTTQRFQRAGLDSPRLDAELLLASCLGVDRVRLYVDHDKPLGPEELARYRGLVQRRLAREPLAYIIGQREFWSLPLEVNHHVLIPRPESETVVERALALIDARQIHAPLIVDVGTGSGAIALALGREVREARIHAVEIDPLALEVARANARSVGLDLTLHLGDLLDGLPADVGRPDLVVANLPYVTTDELARLQPEVRQEPRLALDGGADGLDLMRRLIPQAARRLAPGGGLALEIGQQQADAVAALLQAQGFDGIARFQDLARLDRVVTANRGRT